MADSLQLNSSLAECHNSSDLYSDSQKLFILVTDVILSSAICHIGVVLNALSIAVLRRDVRKSPMSVLLLCLAIFDLVFIFLSAPYIVVYMGLGVLVNVSGGLTLQAALNTSPVIHKLLPLVWFLGNVARTGRNWIIVVVAVDRFMVVQNPFLSARRNSPRRARIYCLCVSAAATAYNLPLLLEYSVADDPCTGMATIFAQPKTMGEHYTLVYKKIMYLLFLSVGPVAVLTVFNILLIRSLLLASRMRAAITREASRRTEETKMLVVIIAVFVVAELPGAAWHLLLDTGMQEHPWFNSYFFSAASLLTLVNSAVNFFIYCVWSKNFRRNMRLALRRGGNKQPNRIIRFESDSERSHTRQVMVLQSVRNGAPQAHGEQPPSFL